MRREDTGRKGEGREGGREEGRDEGREGGRDPTHTGSISHFLCGWGQRNSFHILYGRGQGEHTNPFHHVVELIKEFVVSVDSSNG